MKISRLSLLCAMASAALVTCGDPNYAPPIRREPTTKASPATTQTFAPVILVTVDGVRWQDIFGAVDETLGSSEARMPTLRSLVQKRGAAIGAPGLGRIDASGPNFVSMPGYTEIFTGHAPECANNECERPSAPTFLDDLAARGASVAVYASWEKIDRAVSREHGAFFVSAGRAEGDLSDPFPGAGAYRPDRTTGALALDHLRAARPDVLVIDLGDPDEYAHRGDKGGYAHALEQIDSFLAQIEYTLSEMGERGSETTLFLTADHGRSKDFRDHGRDHPESSRVWFAAEGPRIAARGCVASRAHHLADVADTVMSVSTQQDPKPEIAIAELFPR